MPTYYWKCPGCSRSVIATTLVPRSDVPECFDCVVPMMRDWITEAADSAYWNAQAAELAKELLLYKMEDESEKRWCARWYVDLEHILWAEGSCWKNLAGVAGGMWTWGLGRDNRWFMPMDEWLEVHADWESRQA